MKKTYKHRTLGWETVEKKGNVYYISIPGYQAYPTSVCAGLPCELIQNSQDREELTEELSSKDRIDNIYNDYQMTQPAEFYNEEKWWRTKMRIAIKKHIPKVTYDEVLTACHGEKGTPYYRTLDLLEKKGLLQPPF